MNSCAVAIALGVVACGASVSDENFGTGTTSTSDAGALGDVVLPSTTADSALGGFEASVIEAGGACPASTTPGQGHVCVTVGIAGVGPAAPTDASSLSLAGVGVLVVGLTSTPPTSDSKFAAWTSLPSAASGATLHVSDLPRTVEIDVPPGSYYVAAAFRQAPPFDRKTAAVGDYIQSTLATVTAPSVTAVAGTGVTSPSTIELAAVRGVDATIALDGSLTFPGSGAGPLVVRLNEQGTTTVADIESNECADLLDGGPTKVRLLTTSTATDFDLRAALFDYAADLSDPRVTAWLDPTKAVDEVPAGSLCEGVGEKPMHVYLPADRWLADPITVSLDEVWSGIDSGTTDPSTACHAIALP